MTCAFFVYGISLTSKRRTTYALSWERIFYLVGLQLFPLGVAKNRSVTQNSEFSFPISYNSMPLLPNNLPLLRNKRALLKNNLTT